MSRVFNVQRQTWQALRAKPGSGPELARAWARTGPGPGPSAFAAAAEAAGAGAMLRPAAAAAPPPQQLRRQGGWAE